MPDYTTIANSQVDPESPVTSELMTALRDNPLAIAEGDDTAPRVNSKGMRFRKSIELGQTKTAGGNAFGDIDLGDNREQIVAAHASWDYYEIPLSDVSISVSLSVRDTRTSLPPAAVTPEPRVLEIT